MSSMTISSGPARRRLSTRRPDDDSTLVTKTSLSSFSHRMLLTIGSPRASEEQMGSAPTVKVSHLVPSRVTTHTSYLAFSPSGRRRILCSTLARIAKLRCVELTLRDFRYSSKLTDSARRQLPEKSSPRPSTVTAGATRRAARRASSTGAMRPASVAAKNRDDWLSSSNIPKLGGRRRAVAVTAANAALHGIVAMRYVAMRLQQVLLLNPLARLTVNKAPLESVTRADEQRVRC